MLRTIIKRDGSTEPFMPHKLNGWGKWATETLSDDMDWSSAVLEAIAEQPEVVSSRNLQQALIKAYLLQDTWLYNRMAGKLYASMLRKDLYYSGIPTVQQCQQVMADIGLMSVLDYSSEDYAHIETLIDHDRDFDYAYYQLHSLYTKYSLRDATADIKYETAQFIYMRCAMALAEQRPKATRLKDVEKFYQYFSTNKINLPTPALVNLGTPLKSYVSCCLYTVDDSARSIAVGNHIANTMTYMSAGLGAHIGGIRSVNDPIRNGTIKHQGKLPYLRAILGETKANLQNGRGGACTVFFPIYDPEIKTLINLKNPTETEDRKIRGLDYSWGFNTSFAKKVARNEETFLFNSLTAPELYKALYSKDKNLFDTLYVKYEKQPGFIKNKLSARDLFIEAENQLNETGRIYQHNITEINHHTPFKDTIYQSNLCSEILLPTKPYQHILDLYSTDPTIQSEVATCNLAGLCVDRIDTDSEYADCAYYALLMIDTIITQKSYEFPHVELTSKARMNAGVGIIGLAHYLAKQKLIYGSSEAKQAVHTVAETHMYHLINASLRLSRELGIAPWMHKTLWPEGWLPIDTYNKNVDSIGDFKLQRDWESLRDQIIKNGGIRNSSLVAHMPSESSSVSSGTTNGVYPIRDISLLKTDNNRVNYWVAPGSDELEEYYKSAWDIPTQDLTDMYAIIQKFADQSISADYYTVVTEDTRLSSKQMIQDFLYRVKMGIKTHYYKNQKTSSKSVQVCSLEDTDCESCKL